jgi:hypothetical protein
VAQPRRGNIDRGLLLLILGVVALIVAGLVAIPVAVRRTPQLAPATTPEGAVQRFYQAAYRGDYTAAYGFLSTETQRKLAVSELQQQMAPDLQDSQMRVRDTTVHASTATVRVTLTHVRPAGLFGSGEWTSEHEVLLQREGETWKIASGPFFLNAKP